MGGAVSIACRDVTVRYGDRMVLDVPALEIGAGERLAIVGRNGAGKSTLVGVLGLTRAPTTGTVRIGGQPAPRSGATALRRRVATLFQESLLLDAAVAWNLRLPLRMRGLPRHEIAARVERWSAAFGVESLLARHAAALSGGEARRVCLARAFAIEPEALLIDEPLAGVDAPFREEILTRLAGALGQRGLTTVLVTHDLGEALRLADRLAVIVDGRIRQIGAAAEVLAAPADPEVALLVGTETYVHGRGEPDAAGTGRVRIGDASLVVPQPLEPGADGWLAIRPEDVTLFVGEQHPAGGAQNYVRATVLELRPRGPTTLVRLDAGFPLSALLLPGTIESLAIRPGVRVWASLKATAVRRV